MTWVIINVTASLTVAVLVSYLLGAYGDRFNVIERLGLGMAGGGSILTIGPILSRSVLLADSPYDDWSGTLLRVGLALVLIGVFARLEGFVYSPRLTPPTEGVTG